MSRAFPHRLRNTAVWLSLAILWGGAMGCSGEVVESFPEEFAGVGLELRIESGSPYIVRPLPGGPSEQAGLRKGDTITTINGHSTSGLGLGDVVMKLRGLKGSQVTLGVDRGGMKVIAVVRRDSMKKNKNNLYRVTQK